VVVVLTCPAYCPAFGHRSVPAARTIFRPIAELLVPLTVMCSEISASESPAVRLEHISWPTASMLALPDAARQSTCSDVGTEADYQPLAPDVWPAHSRQTASDPARCQFPFGQLHSAQCG